MSSASKNIIFGAVLLLVNTETFLLIVAPSRGDKVTAARKIKHPTPANTTRNVNELFNLSDDEDRSVAA
jgi:hypothetical protein